MRKIFSLTLALLMTTCFFAQEDKKDGDKGDNKRGNSIVRNIKIKDNMYMITGRGGNIGVNTGENGVLVIDSQFAELSPDIIASIKRVSNDKPIQFLVNTHHHGDHVGGNENFSKEGAIIYAHDNVRYRILKKEQEKAEKEIDKAYDESVKKGVGESMSQEEAEMNAKRGVERMQESLDIDYISPMITYSENSTMYYNGQKIMLLHLHKAHTDGDTMIFFTDSNVIHTGDAYIKGKYPFVDVKNGGSVEGYINGLQKIMALSDEDTQIIPGHGTLATRADVEETLKMMKYLKDRVAYYYLTGKTLEEILPLEDVGKIYDDKGFGGGFISTESFITVLYNAAAKKYKNKRAKPQK